MTTPPRPMSQASSGGAQTSSSPPSSAAKKSGGGLKEELTAALAEQAMTEEVHDAVERFLARMPSDPAQAKKEFYDAAPRSTIDPDQQKKLDAIFDGASAAA